MATIKCTISRSSWYEMYIEYSVSQNVVSAKSTISHALKLKQLTNSYDFNGTMNVSYRIGDDTFSYNDNVNIDDKGDKGYTITIKSGTTTIQHNTSNGTGSFYVSCSGSCNSGGYGPGDISISAYYQSLPTIDRAAPSVSLTTASITASGVTITASSNSTCDNWDYSLDNGSTWYDMSSTVGTSASKAITGLSPNTTYNIKVRARRQYNQVWNTSSARSITTLGNSLLNSVNELAVDVTNPVLTMNWTVYAGYTHTLVIKDGSTTVLTITGLTCSVGTNNKTHTLTATQRTTILTHMRNKASFTATYYLSTYSGNTQIGSTVSKTATIKATSGTSAPTFSNFTHSDTNAKTTAITENNQIYIKGYSTLQLVIGTVTPENEASISSYKVTVGSESKNFTTTTINYGAIAVSGNVTLKVEVIDSRGFSTAVTKTIQVVDYEDIVITDWHIRRKNEVEATVQLTFSGELSPITIGNEARNAVLTAKFRYAPNGGSWSGWSNLTITQSSSDFEFVTLELSNSSGVIDFNPSLQYVVEIKVTDRLSADNEPLVLNKGTPLVAFRAKKVGINTPDPQDALDVRDGKILTNGYAIQGFVAELGNTEDLDKYKQGGIWTQHLNANASTSRHYPAAIAGYLEVFENPQGYVLQRYTAYDCSRIYIRYFYSNKWYAWKSITLS